MVDIEDLKIYFYDTFLATDQFEEETSGTGYILKDPSLITLSGGVTSGSEAMINYKGIYFNPKYAEAIFKIRLSSKENVVAFWGFKSTLNVPTDPMTESHVGFLILNNKVYLSSADGDNQQKVEIGTIDVTKVYEYKIIDNSFYYKPLPQIESYLGLPTIDRVERTWRHLQTNSTYPPEDQVHYLVAYLKNNTLLQNFLYINKVIYKEGYAD